MAAMGWVRHHRRYGAWFGLAALALQIVLSFGHIHLDGRTRASGAVASKHITVAQQSQQAPLQQAPSQKAPDSDDYCVICASIHLAATSFASQAPVLPVPVAYTRIARVFAVADGAVEPRRAAFRSRAPPAA